MSFTEFIALVIFFRNLHLELNFLIAFWIFTLDVSESFNSIFQFIITNSCHCGLYCFESIHGFSLFLDATHIYA